MFALWDASDSWVAPGHVGAAESWAQTSYGSVSNRNGSPTRFGTPVAVIPEAFTASSLAIMHYATIMPDGSDVVPSCGQLGR